MGQVVAFPRRAEPDCRSDLDEVIAFQLMTAIDCAIKDLGDIAPLIGSATARKQTEECRRKLQRVFAAALREA